MAQSIKDSPAMHETCVRSLGWEDPLKKGMTTHSSIFAWKIPWTEEPGGLQSMGSHSQTWLSNWHTIHVSQASQIALVVKNLLDNAGRHKRLGFNPWVWKGPWRGAVHSSILAWRIPWTGLWGPWGHGVRYNWSDLALLHTFIYYCSNSFLV